MNEKMKDPECVTHKVNIAPHDYSKENFLFTFTPQKQLTPEQIFWSQDLIKMKTEALKEQTTASRPIKALTVYPPNTPVTLVPRVLPTKSQVKIHIFTLIQLFLEFDKPCKKRITPTRLTGGKGVMLSQGEVFCVAMNSELNVSRFTEIHVANTTVDARCLELKVELSNLFAKSHNDNHDQLVNRFSSLEVTALTNENVNLKAQTMNNVNSISKDQVIPTVLASGKYAIDVEPIPSHLRNNREAHLVYLRHLKEIVKTIHEIIEEAKFVRPLDNLIVFACHYTKHSQELLEYTIGTCTQDSRQRDKKRAPAPLIRKKQVTFIEQCDTSNSNIHKHVSKLNTKKTNVPVPPSTGVNRCIDASGSQPRSNTKKNRISPAKGVNKMHV
nr:hypothetical protein [Tanacetum cinerariifolium]